MKNQTEKAWLKGQLKTDLGTGIFLFRNTGKTFIKDITYTDCKKRGELAIAYKWVPHAVATFEELQNPSCGIS